MTTTAPAPDVAAGAVSMSGARRLVARHASAFASVDADFILDVHAR